MVSVHSYGSCAEMHQATMVQLLNMTLPGQIISIAFLLWCPKPAHIMIIIAIVKHIILLIKKGSIVLKWLLLQCKLMGKSAFRPMCITTHATLNNPFPSQDMQLHSLDAMSNQRQRWSPFSPEHDILLQLIGWRQLQQHQAAISLCQLL